MEIYSVNGDFYMSYDLAVIKSAGTHFKIKKHEVDETEHLEVDSDKEKIWINDEDGREYEIEFDATYSFHEEEHFSEAYFDCDIDNIQVNGHSIVSLNLSSYILKDIKNEVFSMADNICNEKLNDIL